MHILYISQTRLEESFPTAQFAIEGFKKLRAIMHELIPFSAPERTDGWGKEHIKMNFDYFQIRK